ncbi:transcriptional regulators LacI family [Candidatus Termititenax persephonae]|uniref:Transcriptional regulators LacI family n=1 Tax=Candidatus Termititenax persephonae TaxID=2218525 RepID=A0A388TH93_9BACT|nr:transcriptional regulators LacI family [Candidatus Termititenax persephonae]
MGKKVILQDIAAACSVSVAAVSAAFRRPTQISKTLRAQILQTAQEMGYAKTPEIKNIGLVFENFRNHFLGEFYNEIIFGILARSAELGLRTQIFNSLQVDYQEICDINGFIVIGHDSIVHLNDLERTGQPFVLADCTGCALPRQREIFFDQYQGAKELTEFICNCRHTQIAIINGETDVQNHSWLDFRRAAEDVFKANGLPLQNLQILQASYQNIETVEIALNKIFSAKTLPTCVMCSDDLFAYYAYAVLERYGLRVPEDISVTGFDGITTPYYLKNPEPQLTTVLTDRIGLGRQAVDFLLNILQNKKGLPKNIVLPTHLKIGRSVKRLAGNEYLAEHPRRPAGRSVATRNKSQLA